MTEKTKQDREAVKVLAIAVGVREAARRTGLKESTVKSWSTRDKWFTQPKLPPTMISPASNASIQPAAALAARLEERKSSSKLHLSRYVTEASAEAAEHPQKLAITGKAKDLAQIHQALWPEKEASGSGVMAGLAVYANQAIIQVGKGE